MRRYIFLLITFFFLFLAPFAQAVSVTPSPSPSPNPENVTSYELFWPVTAGKVMGDSLYSVKTLKENVRGWLIFGNYKKSEYSLLLSEKRLVEAEKLITVNKDEANAIKTLAELTKQQDSAVTNFQKARDTGIDVYGLQQRIINSFDNQILILKKTSPQATETERNTMDQDISRLTALIAQIQ